jgi:glycine/D-amino acid oxidase-like deaminating enzyme
MADVIVIGGGIVGAAIAYGLARDGVQTLMIDGADGDFRAAAGNFGLVWQHGKGLDMPAYQDLTRASVSAWRDFGSELAEVTGTDVQLEQNGGLTLCLGEEAFDARRGALQRLHNQTAAGDPDWEMIDRASLARMLPDAALGAEVVGASFGRDDGQVNPLRLLAALHAAIIRMGGEVRGGTPVRALRADGDGYVVEFGGERAHASRVVLAAGLGTKALAAQVGMDIPIRPLRGQILVTERVQPFLPLPTMDIRQTGEGTVMIGSTQEEVGFDASTTGAAAGMLSHAALRSFPGLADASMVRQWSGLRVMTPDGHPIYQTSDRCPGVFVAQCHSGVTLAAFHAAGFAAAVADGRLPAELDVFHQRRFNVSQAA